MSKLSQKEYLKKYLSSDDKLKNKKKKSKDSKAKKVAPTVKIIDDDDYGQHSQNQEVDEEMFATNEEAPQIVGIIDERAPDVILKQEYQQSGKWKKIGDTESSSNLSKQKNQRRRSRSLDSSPRREKSPDRKDISSDGSPPRKRKNSSDASPPRRDYFSKRDSSDFFPPRKSRRSDNTPPRRPTRQDSVHKDRRSQDTSPPRRKRRIPESRRERKDSPIHVPSRHSDSSSRQKRSRWSPEVKRELKSPSSHSNNHELSPRSSRMTKTLDGKASGLQDARTLKRENDEFKSRQEKMFREMKPEVSGRNAEIVIRDRRGRNKEFEKDIETERQKAEIEEARKKKYDRWGKGLKQVEDIEKRYQEHVHEANKPFARTADDDDLQVHLRNKERIDDPMLEYFRKKKQDENKKKGVEEKPKYQGQFADNRFNLRPGHRWDGVDRSNGYEKKYFDMVNSKKSLEEEAYRYSTEDM